MKKLKDPVKIDSFTRSKQSITLFQNSNGTFLISFYFNYRTNNSHEVRNVPLDETFTHDQAVEFYKGVIHRMKANT